MGRSQPTAAALCGLPKRDRFMLYSFARPYVPANDRPRKAAGLTRDSGIAALHGRAFRWRHRAPPDRFGRLTHFCSTTERLSTELSSPVKGDYRKTGRLSTSDRFELEVNVIGVKRGKVLSDRPLGYRSSVDSLNEFECQRPDRWSYQRTRMAIGTDRRSRTFTNEPARLGRPALPDGAKS
jgi:hypothetical protein